MVGSSHLFAPMPDVIREDTAFLDRIHFYLPGWEIPKMQMAMFTAITRQARNMLAPRASIVQF